MDIIFIENLNLKTRIGVYPFEQTLLQTITIDVELRTNIAQAAQSDQLSDTLDYAKITDFLKNYIEGKQFTLLESLAEGIATLLIQEFHVTWVKLKVTKPHALKNGARVGVCIERSS